MHVRGDRDVTKVQELLKVRNLKRVMTGNDKHEETVTSESLNCPRSSIHL